MRSTGIVRKVDNLGRVVLPIELRRSLNIELGDGLEIFVDGDRIVLNKYSPGCVFCDTVSNLVEYNGNYICNECLDRLKKMQ